MPDTSDSRSLDTERSFHPSPTARRITDSLRAHVADIVRETQAQALFVYADALPEIDRLDLPPDVAEKTLYVTRTVGEDREEAQRKVRHLRVPNVSLTRVGQVQMALFLAHSRGFIRRGDVVVFLTGVAASGTLDALFVTEIGREFEMLCTPDEAGEEDFALRPEVVERVIEIATALGSEGREGHPVGALFVVGDSERVLSLSRQLILNPFRGYPEEQRNILDPALEETIKELATVDGAFVIRRDGTVVSAGTYLKTASQDEAELPQGLGSRHHAAAGITAVSRAVAVTVSQSTGTVTIFRHGRIVTSIERPRAVGLAQEG